MGLRKGKQPSRAIRPERDTDVVEMNPLYIDSQRVGLGVEKFSLYIKDLKTKKIIEKFEPRQIPYDSIFIQRPNGFVSFAALNWCVKHAISLTVLNWRGNILAQFLPEEPISPELKIAQVQSYLDRTKHLLIAKKIVETKLERQKEFLESLSHSYPIIDVPQVPILNSTSEDFLRNQEARFAFEYFEQYGLVCEEIGFKFQGRQGDKRNMHAADLVNGLLNYGYGFLKVYVRRSLNAIGLDNSIPFLHDLRKSKSLSYDIMELWRINVDYSILLTLEQLKRSRKTHRLTDDYELLLNPETIKRLFENLKMNLSLEEILFNSRLFAKFLLGEKKTLEFALRPLRVRLLFENEEMKSKVLTKSYRELRMNKSTLWAQKKRLQETGSLRVYNKTKTHFV
jgi:CRISPR-associated endonuclease Cas1